jgi:hemerythrin-like metal-binding protein
MPNRVQWEPGFSVGHGLIDTQHQALLAQCNVLADCCLGGGGGGDGGGDGGQASAQAFDQAFNHLKALAHQHFETEASLLASGKPEALEDHQVECEEFDYLAGEVATAENFDRLELQRFIALWCVGHIAGSAKEQLTLLAGDKTPA